MDLSQLAALLRENGDQVLNGLSKLSLSIKLLKDLNESFGLVVEEREALSSTFQVISTSNSKVELMLDLQFLHDFVQRIVGLKLIQDNSEHCDLISINKFKNLKLLELRKVPINQIVGLQSLRNQLQYIICVRCLLNLKDLFISCGGDESQAFIWSELKEAVLSYNNLESIDNSFEYVPWLQTLDISHNSIVNAQAIDCLPNLKHLNLGFNHLETVPIFKKELFRNLQILILKSNYIGDLTGLLYLDNLVTLDLSCNCLVDHQTLSPIAQLAALQWLNLEGNPLSFHPNHRNITAKYLHSNTATVKFVLDRVFLSKLEIKLIGTYYPSSKFSGQFRREHQISISSNISELTNSSDMTQVTQVPASELTRSLTQRSKKIRTAVISETDEKADVRDEQGDIVNPELIKSINSVGPLNIPSDHVETQKKIESLRNEYGEEWLKGQGGSIMQDILGIEKTESPRLSSTPYEQDFMIHAVDIFNKPLENVANAVSAIVTDTDPDKADVISDISANNTFVTASESFDADDTESEFERKSDSDEDYDEEDEEERPFLAQIHRKNHEPEEIFIVLTNKYIKERDCLSVKVRAKWLLEVISSCEIISKDPTTVCLEFDTVRRNMQQREYVFEEKEAQKFHREISNIISAKPMSALNQTIYRCVKCSTQFSQDKNFNFKDADNPDNLPICPIPNCRSTIVYELDEESTPTNRSVLLQNNNGFKSIERPESPSECSIASETESNPVAQIHVIAEVHTNSKATAVTANRSATSVQESSTSSHISVDDNQILENNFKKYESDIEVISNPSQSSIEVLEDSMRNRKRSSEERRTMIAPTLGTISDVSINAPLQGLTESSSSSSFTESVCTAYDTQVHVSRPSSGLEMKHPIQEEAEDDKKQPKEEKKEEEKNKTNLITSLFEGLFSGPTVGTKSEKTTNQNDIKFDYTENFSNIDHRIKYHLYQNIFEDEHEHFVWMLKCVLVSIINQPIDGCIILSTHKVYVLHMKDYKPSDELSAWLVKKESFTIDRLQTVYTLPWKQGIGLEIRGAAKKKQNHLCCLLQDMQRTSNFLAFLADNPLPDSCDLVCVHPERPMLNLQQLLISQYTNATPKDSTLCLLSIFNKCTIANSESSKLNLGVLLVTKTDLILLNDVFWLLPDAEKEPTIFASQPISNLLEVDIEEMTLDFHFLDEIAGCEEVWSITFETAESLNTAISTVKPPWEEIFLVQLQVNHKIHSV